jgi:hypothetical protein
MQGVQLSAHDSGLVFGLHCSPHRWWPAAQVRVHLSPSQVAVPLGEVGQGVQLGPQAVRLLASTQMPPHLLVPGGQLSQKAASSTQDVKHGFFPAGQDTEHLIPSHMAAPPSILGQGSQATPQLSVELFEAHMPLQLWLPAGQPVPPPPGSEPPVPACGPSATAPPLPPCGMLAPPPAPPAASARAVLGPCMVGSY